MNRLILGFLFGMAASAAAQIVTTTVVKWQGSTSGVDGDVFTVKKNSQTILNWTVPSGKTAELTLYVEGELQ